MKLKYLSILLIFFIFSCNSKKGNQDKNEEHIHADKKRLDRTTSTDGVDIKLHVTAKIAVLREEPDPVAKEVGRCKEKDILSYLNEITTFTTPMKIQGIDYDEPWLKAKTTDGKEGWIYAGTISFDGLSDKKLAEMVFDRRLYKILGDELTAKLKVYQKEVSDLQTLPAFRMLFHRSADLRKEIDKIVNEKLALATKDSLPDFFWLNEAFPGFMVHLVKKNTEYRLFRDFRYWAQLAAHTEEETDNILIETFIIAYQTDSIEFLHQDWRLELSEDERYSLLGRGIHKAVLDGIETASTNSEDFKPELFQLKQQLLDDISFSKDFWEKRALIIKELDEIIATKYKCLTKADRVELATRRKLFNDPNRNNLRTGIYDGGE